MITDRHRVILRWLIKLRLWRAVVNMRIVDFMPCPGTRWLFERMLRMQSMDDRHHAPCCPANHYHYRRLVFQRCTCGAR